jgi:hypothetical protein
MGYGLWTRGRDRLVAGVAITLATLAFLAPSPASARDCPSLLSGHLFQIGDTLELGAEFRAFYFGVSVGEGLPVSPDPMLELGWPWENNVFLGLRTLLYWYPAEGLTFVVEDEIRYRWPGWDGHAVPGLDHRPVSLFVEYETHDLTFTGGLHSFAFGTSAVLDQRFIGLSAQYEHDVFSIELLGGMTARHYMRNAAHSMWMSYMSDTNGWKFTSENLAENFAAGLIFSLRRVVRPYRLQLLYLYSHTSYEHLRSHAVSLHFAGPIWSPYLSFVLEAMVLIDHENHPLPGMVAELRARFGRSANIPSLSVGAASSFLHTIPGVDDDPADERRLASVYENLSLGMIRRFNLRQGHIFYTRANWQIIEQVGLFAAYYLNINGVGVADELDVGVSLQVNDLYRLSLAYVGMDVAGEPVSSHAIYAEARIIIGR